MIWFYWALFTTSVQNVLLDVSHTRPAWWESRGSVGEESVRGDGHRRENRRHLEFPSHLRTHHLLLRAKCNKRITELYTVIHSARRAGTLNHFALHSMIVLTNCSSPHINFSFGCIVDFYVVIDMTCDRDLLQSILRETSYLKVGQLLGIDFQLICDACYTWINV